MQPGESTPEGFHFFRQLLEPDRQRRILDKVLLAVERAGWVDPAMPRSGRPFSVRMCNLGSLGWVSDRVGYRYQPAHPVTGYPWPVIPIEVLQLWSEIGDYPHPPECCLVNLYRGNAKLGLHRDED